MLRRLTLTFPHSRSLAAAGARVGAALCLGLLAHTGAHAQASSPGGDPPNVPVSPPSATTDPSTTPPATSTRNATVQTLGTQQSAPISSATRPQTGGTVLIDAATGRSVGSGSRVLRAPAPCSPKTGSLDCAVEAGAATQGSDVSTRVRRGVIGEAGSGRAATEGSGTVKGQETCVPAPGRLSCD